MITGTQKYRYYGSLDGGINYVELFLNNYPKISNKPESKEIFYRVKSDEWIIQRFKNIVFYDTLLNMLQNPCLITLDILFKCDTDSETLYNGALKINNVTEINEAEGIIVVSPNTVDDYIWWDKDKDKDIVIGPNLALNTVQYSATSVEYILEVPVPVGIPPRYGGMAVASIVTIPTRIVTYEQQRLPFAYTGYTQGNGVFGLGYTPAVTNCPTDLFYKAAAARDILPDTELDNSFFRLDELIEDVTTQLDNPLTVVSTFLNSANNPITGATNNFNNVMIAQIADVVGLKGKVRELTFDGLMAIIKKWLCYWWIDGTDLHIEHIKTIDDSRANGIDLTDSIYNVRKYLTLENINGDITDKTYSFKLDAPAKEEFTYSEGDNRIGNIEYTNPLADDKVKKHDLRGFMADVNKLISFPDSLNDENYIILVTDFVSSSLYQIREESNGTDPILNWHLSWDKILNNYWIYDRPFFSGLINTVAVNFLTLQHMKVQKEISFPDLEEIYDPKKYITTNLGEGLIDSIELDTENGFINTTLKHKACG
jgi:hypothetical protein